MKLLRELKIVLIISLVICILMLMKFAANRKYPGDVQNTAEISASRSNFLTWKELETSKERITLIIIDNRESDSTDYLFSTVNVPVEDIVKGEFLKKISQPGTRYVIKSGSRSRSEKAWVILNQLGVENLYILETSDPNDEQFKYQFQPDTTIRLESDAVEE